MGKQERYHGLDFVRAVAMMLGVVLHVSMFFCDVNSFHWLAGEYKRDSINTFAVKGIHLFRMQLFILLAGFFAELVFQRKGMNILMKDRIKRILWPFLVGIIIFMPIMMYVTDDTWPGAFSNIFDNASNPLPVLLMVRTLPYFSQLAIYCKRLLWINLCMQMLLGPPKDLSTSPTTCSPIDWFPPIRLWCTI